MQDVDTAVTIILKLNRAELDKVVRAIKTRRTQLDMSKMLAFSKGDKVRFSADRAGFDVITGTVTKVNRKTLTVETGDRGIWRVAPGLATHV